MSFCSNPKNLIRVMPAEGTEALQSVTYVSK